MSVTVLIPSIPNRGEYLSRALSSVALQTRPADKILVRIANDRMGAPEQRDELLAQVDTTWIACLDDDDWLYPHHLEVLLDRAEETDADLCYGWFDVIGGSDPFPQFEGLEWDNAHPHQVPITALYRTTAVRACGGWSQGWDVEDPECPGADEYGNRAGEDLALVRRMAEKDLKIVHVNRRTWSWRHHAHNTMGLPSRAFA